MEKGKPAVLKDIGSGSYILTIGGREYKGIVTNFSRATRYNLTVKRSGKKFLVTITKRWGNEHELDWLEKTMEANGCAINIDDQWLK